MRLFVTIAMAAVAAAAPLTARAADPLMVAISTNESLPITGTEFDWNGFYAGVYGLASLEAGNLQPGLGIDVGVNARFEFVLVGAEVALQGLADGSAEVQALGRVGVAATDALVLYAAGGLGLELSPPGESTALFGGGVELAVTDDISLRGQYLQGVPLSGADNASQFTLGANFHF